MVVQKVLCYALLALLHSAGNCRSKQLWVAGPKFASTIPFPAQSRCRHDEHSLNGSDDAKWWCQGILLHDITKAHANALREEPLMRGRLANGMAWRKPFHSCGFALKQWRHIG